MGAIIKSTIATILFIVMVELSTLWIFIPKLLKIENFYLYYVLIQGLCQLLLVVLFTWLTKRKKISEYCRTEKSKWYLIAVVSGSLFIIIQSPLKWIYNLIFGTDYYIEYHFDGLVELMDINVLSTILFIPIAEELFFRGCIQEELQKKLKIWIAIIIASIFFALIHAPYLYLFWSEYIPEWHSFYLTLFGGLISGIIYYKSESIIPSIIFHVFWNLGVVIV